MSLMFYSNFYHHPFINFHYNFQLCKFSLSLKLFTMSNVQNACQKIIFYVKKLCSMLIFMPCHCSRYLLDREMSSFMENHCLFHVNGYSMLGFITGRFYGMSFL